MSGACGGLGRAITERLRSDGFVVATCDLDPWAGAELHAELDVVDSVAVDGFVARVAIEIGAPDVIVTAAGAQRSGPSHAFDVRDWTLVLDVNLTGTWNVIRSALPHLVERRAGRIITISSEIGVAGLEGYAAYAASKGGVIASRRHWRVSSPPRASR